MFKARLDVATEPPKSAPRTSHNARSSNQGIENSMALQTCFSTVRLAVPPTKSVCKFFPPTSFNSASYPNPRRMERPCCLKRTQRRLPRQCLEPIECRQNEGGQAAAQALGVYSSLGICWDKCLKRTLPPCRPVPSVFRLFLHSSGTRVILIGSKCSDGASGPRKFRLLYKVR